MKPICRILTAALFSLAVQGVCAEVKTLTDVRGREVRVDVPAKRVVLGFYYPDYIAVSGVDKFDNVVGISREFWEKFNPGSWSLYRAKIPSLQNIGDIGNVNAGTFSFEKTLAMKPDVVVLADWQYDALKEEMPRFEKAGIPVVVVDFNAQTVERHTASAKLFGEIAGTPERAGQVAGEYAQGMADIQKRVAEAGKPKPKIYIEFGDKGPAEHSFTFGKNMWGAIADTVGGDNIAAAFIKDWGAINPEQFLAAKPDVVIISGTEAADGNGDGHRHRSRRSAKTLTGFHPACRLGGNSRCPKQPCVRHLPYCFAFAFRFGIRPIYRQSVVSRSLCRCESGKDLP